MSLGLDIPFSVVLLLNVFLSQLVVKLLKSLRGGIIESLDIQGWNSSAR
jgi:hypothetical protein